MDIDKLKSTIAKKGGLALANRFNVMFAPPAVSLLNINPQQIVGSLLSGGFSAGNLINDPRDISILCTSVSLPGRNLSTFDHQDYKQSNKHPYTFIDDDVTMKFHLTNDYYMRNMLEQWQSGIFNSELYVAGFKKDYSVDIIIQQLNKKNIPVYGVRLEKAFPVSYEAIDLANTNENAAVEMSVTFAYDRFVPEGPLSSTGSAIRSALDFIT